MEVSTNLKININNTKEIANLLGQVSYHANKLAESLKAIDEMHYQVDVGFAPGEQNQVNLEMNQID